jgi:iron complex transport system permease protein
MKQPGIKVALLLLLLLSVLLGVGMGQVRIAPAQMLGIAGRQLGWESGIAYSPVQEAVLLTIRLPRVLLAVLVGAALAVCGAALQGLYRNPLADPALIGISSGASVAAVAFIVLGAGLVPGWLAGIGGISALSAATFAGALGSAVLVYRLALVKGKVLVSTMLLAGIGVNAVAMAVTGVFTYNANDAQLRSITFWTLGSLGGATWNQVWGALPFIGGAVLILPLLAKPLNAFSLNEQNAAHLGIRTERVKRIILVLTALAVGASVAVAGVIGFVGLLVPNIIRIIAGPDHRQVLPLSALGGALLLVVADVVARTAFGASELPIGILTALLGGPFFIYLLLKERKSNTVS